ncbi:MAG: HAMP domain-containing histidine kinase [Planctomycetes bacterium]|nr:HAMP domain-containing histidine kinase [Planctomycetota bacterium]
MEDISQAIKKGLAEAASHHEMLAAVQKRLTTSASESRSIAARLSSATTVTPQLRRRVMEALSSLEPLIGEAKESIARLSSYLEELSALRGMGQVLQDRVDSLRRQMDDMYETVALGITAEAMSHEVFNVADRLARRAKAAQTSLHNRGVGDRAMLAFIEHVHSAVMALRKQMSFLSPALRYVRERREDIDLPAFLEELRKEFYQERLTKSRITLAIVSKNDARFMVRMNRGKLVQVVDNLMLNSEYWLREDLAQKRIADGDVTLEVDRPFLRIWDNGRGIDPTVEHALFQPFVSAKARGQGRGLGLFIVKQLLDSEGCGVGILPERNKHRRLFKFQIDLRGALND